MIGLQITTNHLLRLLRAAERFKTAFFFALVLVLILLDLVCEGFELVLSDLVREGFGLTVLVLFDLAHEDFELAVPVLLGLVREDFELASRSPSFSPCVFIVSHHSSNFCAVIARQANNLRPLPYCVSLAVRAIP